MNLTEKQKQWLAWLLIVLVTAGASTFLGVNYPLPQPPVFTEVDDEIIALGTTHFTCLEAEGITATDNLTVTNDGTVGGDFTVTGTASWGCADQTIDGTLLVSDTLTAQDLYITDTVEIIGNASLSGTTHLSGTVLVTGTLSAASSIDANAGMTIDGGVTNIGGGTPGLAAGDNDLYVTNDFEVAGTSVLSGPVILSDTTWFSGTAVFSNTVLLSNTLTSKADLEHLFFPTIVVSDVAYSNATGASGAVATIADGEIWFVWGVFVNVTADWDCTGDDCQFVVGDGTDADGFVVLADAELQAADTEQTGSPAGWQGLVAATMGVFLDGAVSSAPHIYAPSGAAETIDFLADEGTGDTMSAGTATIYVIYTRIQ